LSNQITDAEIRAIHNELQETHDVGWTDLAVLVVREVLARQDTARCDMFAAAAVPAIIHVHYDLATRDGTDHDALMKPEAWAKAAAEVATVMLAARNGGTP